jgi:4-oxalocrotonate tautomerase
MPHVIVKLYPGRSEEQKQRLAEAIVRDTVEIAACPESAVSVAIEEVAPADWPEKVYRPDILEKPQTLYRKPGSRSPFE